MNEPMFQIPRVLAILATLTISCVISTYPDIDPKSFLDMPQAWNKVNDRFPLRLSGMVLFQAESVKSIEAELPCMRGSSSLKAASPIRAMELQISIVERRCQGTNHGF